jgi:hypothetical protein
VTAEVGSGTLDGLRGQFAERLATGACEVSAAEEAAGSPRPRPLREPSVVTGEMSSSMQRAAAEAAAIAAR